MGTRLPAPGVRVDFNRTKYGAELLVDVAWIHEMPTFLRDGPHWLTFYDILLVTRGRGWYQLDGVRHRVQGGRVFFTSPGQVRHWMVTGLDGLCLFFPSAFLEEFFRDPLFVARLPFFHIEAASASLTLTTAQRAFYRRRLSAMHAEFRSLGPDTPHLLRAGLYEVLVRLARDFIERRGVAPPPPNLVVQRYRELVHREATRQHRAAWYASELAVSPGHLNSLCHRHLGMSAKAVIMQQLAIEARRRLLHTDDSAARIGYTLGFRDPSYFSRFFRRLTGKAPSEHRGRG